MVADNGIWGGVVGGGALASVLAVAKWMLSRFKQDALDEQKDKATAEAISGLRSDITDLVHELKAIGEGHKVLQVSQAGVNDMVAKTLEGLADRMERHDDKIQDLSSNSKLLNEHVSMLREQQNLMRAQLERKADKQ